MEASGGQPSENLCSTIEDVAVISENKRNQDNVNRTSKPNLWLAEQLLDDQTKEHERRSLRQQSLPPDINTLLPENANDKTQ